MSGFNRRIWRVKPPQGVPLVDGHLAPNVLALPFNEYSTAQYRSYARLRGSNAYRLFAPNNGNQVVGQSQNGPTLRFTASSGVTVVRSTAGTDVLPINAITILMGHRKTDTTNRQAQGFGNPSFIHAHMPYADGNVYWDFGGSDGSHRISVAASNFIQYSVWGFTSGSRGREIWRNGRIIQTGASTATRSSGQTDFSIGAGDTSGFNESDLADYDFFYMWDTQLPPAIIQSLSTLPFSVFEPYRTRIFGITGGVIISESITLGVGAHFGPAAAAARFASIALGAGAATTPSATVAAVAQETLGVSLAVTPQDGLTDAQAIALGVDAGVLIAGKLDAKNAIALHSHEHLGVLDQETFGALRRGNSAAIVKPGGSGKATVR